MDDRKCYPCIDGPFRKQFLWLGTRSTAVLKLEDWHGRYVADRFNKQLRWEKIPPTTK